jgi:hypothetical protein
MSWQPIETAPKDGTRILGWSEKHVWKGIHTCYWGRDGELNPSRWHGGHCRIGHIDQPTHWMQLPEPPQT